MSEHGTFPAVMDIDPTIRSRWRWIIRPRGGYVISRVFDRDYATRNNAARAGRAFAQRLGITITRIS